jgi:hypothetical protein
LLFIEPSTSMTVAASRLPSGGADLSLGVDDVNGQAQPTRREAELSDAMVPTTGDPRCPGKMTPPMLGCRPEMTYAAR